MYMLNSILGKYFCTAYIYGTHTGIMCTVKKCDLHAVDSAVWVVRYYAPNNEYALMRAFLYPIKLLEGL